jgi:DNA-binding IclR family transcriptional regulator
MQTHMAKQLPLERAIQVLEQVASSGRAGLALSDIARGCGLPVPTAYRLVQGLIKTGLLIPGEGNKQYVLGRRLFRLLLAGTDDGWLKIAAQPVLDRLAAKSHETAYLAQLVGQKIISISWAVPESGLRTKVYPGDVMPPHAAASAKAILAHQPGSVVQWTLAGTLDRFTPHTKTELAQIAREHARIRKDGFATCWDEMELGLGAIACPIEVEGIGVQYAVAMTGLTARLKARPLAERVAALRLDAEQLRRVIQNGVREVLGPDAARFPSKRTASKHVAAARQAPAGSVRHRNTKARVA